MCNSEDFKEEVIPQKGALLCSSLNLHRGASPFKDSLSAVSGCPAHRDGGVVREGNAWDDGTLTQHHAPLTSHLQLLVFNFAVPIYRQWPAQRSLRSTPLTYLHPSELVWAGCYSFTQGLSFCQVSDVTFQSHQAPFIRVAFQGRVWGNESATHERSLLPSKKHTDHTRKLQMRVVNRKWIRDEILNYLSSQMGHI